MCYYKISAEVFCNNAVVTKRKRALAKTLIQTQVITELVWMSFFVIDQKKTVFLLTKIWNAN